MKKIIDSTDAALLVVGSVVGSLVMSKLFAQPFNLSTASAGLAIGVLLMALLRIIRAK